MGNLADFSPLIAPDAYCATCGTLMKKEVVKDNKGRPINIVYSCINEETGCGYKVEQDQRLSGMQQVIR